MNDNMLKQSLRLWGRCMRLAFKIVVSPIGAILVFMYAVVTLGQIIWEWANNDQEDYNRAVKEWNELWDGVVEWFSF